MQILPGGLCCSVPIVDACACALEPVHLNTHAPYTLFAILLCVLHTALLYTQAADDMVWGCAVLMGQACIYWDMEHYSKVQTILQQSTDFCSEHEAWKLNCAHTFFMQGGNFPPPASPAAALSRVRSWWSLDACLQNLPEPS